MPYLLPAAGAGIPVQGCTTRAAPCFQALHIRPNNSWFTLQGNVFQKLLLIYYLHALQFSNFAVLPFVQRLVIVALLRIRTGESTGIGNHRKRMVCRKTPGVCSRNPKMTPHRSKRNALPLKDASTGWPTSLRHSRQPTPVLFPRPPTPLLSSCLQQPQWLYFVFGRNSTPRLRAARA